MIGIVGGAGPVAGLDLYKKIIEESKAAKDQEHLPVILWSTPEKIPDRTEFLEGRVQENPAYSLSEIFLQLAKTGVSVAAVPCNTAHAPVIFDKIRSLVKEKAENLKILSIIEETILFLNGSFPAGSTIGVLSTTGTWKERIYAAALEEAGYSVLAPKTKEEQEEVHRAIYHKDYGIKSTGTRVSQKAREILYGKVDELIADGAQAVILGCTEIPLALKEAAIEGVPMIDTVRVLARALIASYAPEKLK